MTKSNSNIPSGRYGRLLVLEYVNAIKVKVACDCGTIKYVRASHIRLGRIVSCGCFQKESCGNNFRTHGVNKTESYCVYMNMISRCYNKKDKRYKDYGGRGITVCEEWLNKNNYLGIKVFNDFMIKNGYKKGLTIDRIDNNGNYCPDNCKISTKKQQARNRRSNVLITAFGETKCISEWVEDNRCLVGHETLRYRIKKGINPEDAISKQSLRTRKT